jgi:hypothetical protein
MWLMTGTLYPVDANPGAKGRCYRTRGLSGSSGGVVAGPSRGRNRQRMPLVSGRWPNDASWSDWTATGYWRHSGFSAKPPALLAAKTKIEGKNDRELLLFSTFLAKVFGVDFPQNVFVAFLNSPC